jgi:hypothetical protein
MEIKTDTRAPMEFLSSRQREGFAGRSFDDMSTASAHNSMHSRLDIPRYAPSTLRLSDALGRTQQSTVAVSADMLPKDNVGIVSKSSSSPKSSFQFDKATRGKCSFDLPHRSHSPPRGVKRRRRAQDVDGPNTAGLCCKKRRLRADLITSRLSQPFSQPATHILNREGAESGDKRFLKMATSVDTLRRIAHLHATSILRFSVMNRIRKRFGIARPGPQQQRMSPGQQSAAAQPREVDATAQAPWKPQSLQVASGATYWRPSGVGGYSPSSPSPGYQGDRSPPPLSKASPPVPRVSKPIALPMPASDLAATQERTSSRIHSVASPELRPDRAAIEEEEDSFAFLHPDFDDYADDDPEHVYSDFGAIFRPGSPDASGDDHSYEEYLDELDGISWATR